MLQLLTRKSSNLLRLQKIKILISKYKNCKFSTKPSSAAAVVEKQDGIKMNEENVMSLPISLLNQRVSTSEASGNASSILSQLNSLPEDAVQRPLDFPVLRNVSELDDSPLPFEEVPGPVILKLWEKYWKYVPLFGTQLIRSVLINRLTEGRLQWNRNITPIRYLFDEYGPVVKLKGPFAGDIVLIHRPEHIQKVFNEENDDATRSAIDILQHYRLNYRKYRFAGPYSAQETQGLEWLKIKKTLEMPIKKQINNQFAKLEITCDELLQRIRLMKNRQDEVSGNFNQELLRWGMESFWIILLNKKLGYLESTGYSETSEASRLIDALSTAHLYMSRCETGFQVWRFMETPFSKKLFNSCDVIDETIGKYIRIIQSSRLHESPSKYNKNENICSSIIENLLVDHSLNPDEVSTLLMDMIILGVQAAVNSQAFLLYFLAKNPRVQKRLFNEIISKTKDYPILNKETLEKMPYLDACIKECLRIRPPFPYLTRLLPKDIILHGYKIPKGTYLIMANQITFMREENFEDPEKFKPERWLKNDDSFSVYSYLPFGKGLRSCMGENIAKLEIMLLTAKIIRNFRVEYEYSEICSRFLMMNVPNRPLRFRFVERD
ncbi:probable cytochrome P450 12a5, mitochondrial isoform X1 [Nasonia vitripennis]|uniref:Cytochrome P450 n=1 Tax=Nasonia vitripennis TaxID=7425 RepID=A0A7M7HBD9_NASVI|nr:probable cytochrome P450 12a5, mitochondrial isoform X1 [Nasonia vitripennis]